MGSRLRYIFETKETKQTESKGKKTQDAKDEVSQQKTIARLQVSVNLTVVYLLAEFIFMPFSQFSYNIMVQPHREKRVD